MNLPLPLASVIWLCIIFLILCLWFENKQGIVHKLIWCWQYIVLLRVPIIAALILLYFPIIATQSSLSDLLLFLYCIIIAFCAVKALSLTIITILAIVFDVIVHNLISLIDISSFFENLFVMSTIFQLAIAFVTISLTSLMVSSLFSIIFINAPIRYKRELNVKRSDYRIDENKRRKATHTGSSEFKNTWKLINTWIYKLSFNRKYLYFLSVFLSLPSLITIGYLSLQDAYINDNSRNIWLGIVVGVFLSIVLYLIISVSLFVIKNGNIETIIPDVWKDIFQRKGERVGYLYKEQNSDNFRLEPGHGLGIFLVLIVSIIYLYLGSELPFIRFILKLILFLLLSLLIFLIFQLFAFIYCKLLQLDLPDDSILLIVLIVSIVIAVIILISGILFPNSFFSLDFPALMYLILIIGVVTSLLGGATFYTDYFRVPLLTALILFSGFSYLIFNIDHFFELNPVSIKKEHLELRLDDADKFYEKISDFQNPLKNRLARQKKEDKTLVLIAASGGGIQAAGWTAQVLQGLNEQLSNSFTDSIGMISSVSGGSVGNMFFLNELINSKHDGNKNLNQYLETALDNSMTDSLDAVGWGLAYPDFFRAIGLPFFDRYIDRASALDKDWEQTMKQKENPPTLQSWREHIWDGDIPIPVFNATLVEDGRRFLISPLKFIDVSLSQIFVNEKVSPSSPESTALDFYTLFQIPKPEQTCNGQKKHAPEQIYDLKISTAARLSASFPYVSPLARNDPDNCIKIDQDDKTFNYHIADGGYFDNAGIHTIIEWLTKEKNGKPFVEVLRDDLNVKRILILQINAFPKPKLKAQNGSLGWTTEFIGPISTLNQVRDSTQIARNQQEVKLFKKAWEKEGNLEIEEFTIYFREIDSYKPPLSWNLSNAQKENIKKAWDEVVDNDSDFCSLKNIWNKWDNK